MTRKRRKWVLPLLVLTACAVCLLAAVLWHQAHIFSSGRWAKDPDSRKMMVGDLMDRVGLLGKTEEEVTALLGSEDSRQSTFKISRTCYPPESTLVYYIGEDLMDSRWLILSLQNGVVSGVTTDVT